MQKQHTGTLNDVKKDQPNQSEKREAVRAEVTKAIHHRHRHRRTLSKALRTSQYGRSQASTLPGRRVAPLQPLKATLSFSNRERLSPGGALSALWDLVSVCGNWNTITTFKLG